MLAAGAARDRRTRQAARPRARFRTGTTRWTRSRRRSHDGDFHEIILSTLPHSVSRWLHVDLPHRVAHLGLPVTTVVARGTDSTAAELEPART